MRHFGFFGTICASAILAGCGGVSDNPDLVGATGTVLYKDKPVSGATVTFVIEKSPLAIGMTNEEGKFIMSTGGRQGVPLGNAKIGITKASAVVTATGGEMKPEDLAQMSEEKMTVGVTEPPAPEIPLKYANPEKSGLKTTVDPDASKNVFDFRLYD